MKNRPATQAQVKLAANHAQQAIVPTRRAPVKPLEEVVDAIRTDSLDAPQTYLEETKVPHGGE